MRVGESVGELLAEEIKPPDQILGPWLTKESLALLYAPRGLGKTFFGLQLAHAVATGSQFLKWKPPVARRVILFDGEMGRKSLYKRLWQIDHDAETSIKGDMLRIVSHEHTGGVMWNISDPQKQKLYEEQAEDSELIVIDNLLTCSAPISNRDDDLSQWLRIQPWLIRLRGLGKAILIIHHSSKSGLQHGTQLRENAMNTIIALKPVPLEESRGALFDVIFEKTRDFYGEEAEPIRVKYSIGFDGRHSWEFKPVKQAIKDFAERKIQAGWKRRDLAKLLGMTFSELTTILEMTGEKQNEPSTHDPRTGESDDEDDQTGLPF